MFVIYTNLNMYILISICIYLHIYMYKYTHVYIYIYINTQGILRDGDRPVYRLFAPGSVGGGFVLPMAMLDMHSREPLDIQGRLEEGQGSSSSNIKNPSINQQQTEIREVLDMFVLMGKVMNMTIREGLPLMEVHICVSGMY
jgi:hypothetical protein